MEKVVIHENWNASNYKGGSDIALVRVDKPIVMFFVSTILKPILFYNDYYEYDQYPSKMVECFKYFRMTYLHPKLCQFACPGMKRTQQ